MDKPTKPRRFTSEEVAQTNERIAQCKNELMRRLMAEARAASVECPQDFKDARQIVDTFLHILHSDALASQIASNLYGALNADQAWGDLDGAEQALHIALVKVLLSEVMA